MHYALVFVPYRKLQKEFHDWAEKKSLSLSARNDGVYRKFSDSLNGKIEKLEIPDKLTVYGLFNKYHDFFTPFAGPPSVVNKIKKPGKRQYIRHGGQKNSHDDLAGELSEKIGQLVERTQDSEAKAREYQEQIQELDLEIATLKKQNEELQTRLDECLRNAIDKVDRAISLKGKNLPKRSYRKKEKNAKTADSDQDAPRTKRKYTRHKKTGDDIASDPAENDGADPKKDDGRDPSGEKSGNDPPLKKSKCNQPPRDAYDGRIVADAFIGMEHGGTWYNTDCHSIVHLPSLVKKREECRKDGRADMYLVLSNSIVYNLKEFRKFILTNNIKNEDEFFQHHAKIKKDAQPFYPENTKDVYGKKLKEIIASVFPPTTEVKK